MTVVATREVSIILPYFNGKQFISDTITSIVSQTFENFEALIIDDGSTNTEDSLYLKELINNHSDSRLRYLYKKNSGLSLTRNYGIELSIGTYIAFLDQDDIWVADKLEKQVTKDIKNSLKKLKNNEFIIFKNVNPPAKYYQRENIFSRGSYLEWNGTVWRSYAELRMNNSNLKMCVVNSDWGLGIIQKGNQVCYPKPGKLTYGLLDEDRINLLNLLSVNDFLMKF